jgi:nucleoside-diphosphate-sugar epimerase
MIESLNPEALNNAKWHGSKVLITGISSFIGQNLARFLIANNANVVGLTRSESKISIYKHVKLDITNHKEITDFLSRHEFDYIFHLAAYSIQVTKDKSSNVVDVFKANIEGTWNLLDAVSKQSKLKKFILSSTIQTNNSAYNELSIYASSKLCAEIITKSLAVFNDIPISILHIPNLFGPGDINLTRIIPSAIRSIMQDENPEILSSGTATLQLCYVKDAIDWMSNVALDQNNMYGDHNISEDRTVLIRVVDIVKLLLIISEKVELKPEIMNRDDNFNYENNDYQQYLGLTIYEQLQQTYEWNKSKGETLKSV